MFQVPPTAVDVTFPVANYSSAVFRKVQILYLGNLGAGYGYTIQKINYCTQSKNLAKQGTVLCVFFPSFFICACLLCVAIYMFWAWYAGTNCLIWVLNESNVWHTCYVLYVCNVLHVCYMFHVCYEFHVCYVFHVCCVFHVCSMLS